MKIMNSYTLDFAIFSKYQYMKYVQNMLFCAEEEDLVLGLRYA